MLELTNNPKKKKLSALWRNQNPLNLPVKLGNCAVPRRLEQTSHSIVTLQQA